MVKVELQLPDALDLIGRALRAGHAFPTAVKMVSDELNDPIGGEFRTLFDEVNYGVSMHTALLNLATRIPVTDLRYFVIAVLIQRETGGNLAELLDNISAIIRARLKLFGQFASFRRRKLSARILTPLPIGVASHESHQPASSVCLEGPRGEARRRRGADHDLRHLLDVWIARSTFRSCLGTTSANYGDPVPRFALCCRVRSFSLRWSIPGETCTRPARGHPGGGRGGASAHSG
jgi:hypothetical protein